MLEIVVNGEIRVDTIIRLFVQHWEIIGVLLMLFGFLTYRTIVKFSRKG
jgi:hypothetical protein